MLVLYDFTFSRLGMVHHGIEVSMSNERRISESVRWVADTLLEFFQKPRLVPDEELRYLGARMKTAARPVEVEGPVIEDLLSVSAYHAGDLKVFVRPEHIVTREFGPSGNLDILDLRNPGPEDLNLARWVSVESPNYGHTISVKANVRSRGMGEYELEAPWKSYFKETGTLPIFLFMPMSCGSPRLFMKSEAVGEGFSATVDPTPTALLDYLRKREGLSSALEANRERPVVIAGDERTARIQEKFVTMLKEFRRSYRTNPFFLAQQGAFPKFKADGQAILEVPADWDGERQRLVYPFQPL